MMLTKNNQEVLKLGKPFSLIRFNVGSDCLDTLITSKGEFLITLRHRSLNEEDAQLFFRILHTCQKDTLEIPEFFHIRNN